MNPKHFRIGNILQDAKGKIAIVEEITKDDGVKAYSGMITSLPLKPVELTEELLIKLGFECTFENLVTKRLDYIKDDRFDYLISKELPQLDTLRFKGEAFSHVEYVHQLQNLFLDLTGIELEYKN